MTTSKFVAAGRVPALFAVLFAALFWSCKSQPAPSVQSYADISGVLWYLTEVEAGGGKTALDRQSLEADGLGDAYTLEFADDGISGKAAPNRYRSAFKARDGRNFSLLPTVSTLMASSIGIDGITEGEYFRCLERTASWELTGAGLELRSAPGTGEDITLRFSRY
jgi:hypothetical protein